MAPAARQLLFACDFEETSLAARDSVAALAAALHASVLLVHVQTSRWQSWRSSGLVDRHRRDRLESWADWLRERGAETRVEVVAAPDAATQLATVGLREQAYAIITGGAEYPGGKGRFEDRTVENLVRLAHQPVWVIKARQDQARLPKRILCGVDSSGESDEALRLAAEIAEQLDAAVSVVHAVSHPPVNPLGMSLEEQERAHEQHKRREAERLEQFVAKRQRSPMPSRVHWGNPAEVLLAIARDERIDLIVVGPGRGGGMKRLLLGSTAGKLLYEAPTSVLLIGEGRLQQAEPVRPRRAGFFPRD